MRFGIFELIFSDLGLELMLWLVETLGILRWVNGGIESLEGKGKSIRGRILRWSPRFLPPGNHTSSPKYSILIKVLLWRDFADVIEIPNQLTFTEGMYLIGFRLGLSDLKWQQVHGIALLGLAYLWNSVWFKCLPKYQYMGNLGKIWAL